MMVRRKYGPARLRHNLPDRTTLSSAGSVQSKPGSLGAPAGGGGPGLRRLRVHQKEAACDVGR